MTYRKVPLVSGEYFHIYNRGNSKQKIFYDDQDMDRFIKLLYLSNSKNSVNFRDDIVEKKIDAWDYKRGETLVSIGVWVLMPNHFHIYITSPKPGLGEKGEIFNISLFMHKLCVSYVKYFNKKYNRTGALFEGSFKAKHIKEDNYAKYLFSYIHLNPIKLIDPTWKEKGIGNTEEAFNYLKNYKWSSYPDHCGMSRKENKILELNNFPDYFLNIKNFDTEILCWMQKYNLPLNPV